MRRKKFFLGRIIAFIAISAVIGLGFVWATQIENLVNVQMLGLERSDDIVTFDDGLQLHFIDVGQGDAAVIVFPNGQVIMVDAGDNLARVRNNISEYLNRYIFPGDTPRKIDLFVATHSHADHIGSFRYVLENYYISHIVRPKSFTPSEISAGVPASFGITGAVTEHDTQVFQRVVDRMRVHRDIDGDLADVTIPYAGKTLNIGGAEIIFYSPTMARYPSGSINELSTIFSVNFEGRRIMFTGDAYQINEQRALELRNGGMTVFGTLPHEIYQVDVLVVAHHGSNTSKSDAFLAKLNPTYSIIQVGRNNRHGHPHSALMGRLEYTGTNVLKTKNEGDILVQISANGQNMEVNGVVHDNFPYWIYYWMIALPIIAIAGGALLAMDLFGKKSNATRSPRARR